MIAQRFRAIGWVAGCAAAALCCYLASQSVASERAALTRVDFEIAKAQDDIRRLNTEIAARSRMAQIERWNTQVLALQAPAPAQFVANEVQLASLAGGKSLPLDPNVVASKGAITTVAYQPQAAKPATIAPPTAPTPVAQPMLRPATYVRARPETIEGAVSAPLVKVSLTRVSPAPVLPDLVGEPIPAPKAKPVEKVADKTPAAEKKPAPAKATVAAKAGFDKKAAPVKKPVAEAVAVAEHKPETAAKPVKKAAPLASASLLPSDLGKLIAAERKGAKSSRSTSDR